MSLTQKKPSVINFITSRFGPLSITEDKIIFFIQGIPGFKNLRRFILIDHDSDGIFKWLQAVDDPMVAFLLTDPIVYKPDYAVPLRASDINALGAKNARSLVTLVMVCVSSESRQLSLNLKGPVLFNSDNMRALQCIIDRDDYNTHFIVRM